MKNIHILPTDKPSRLFIHNAFNDLRFDIRGLKHDNNQNIYITNDEEIKEGDRYVTNNGKIAKELYSIGRKGKIILTTDQDLIKDGVQAIDDEFLEWFVKNPSCDEIEIIPMKLPHLFMYGYKIIIPKEEPKQENCCPKCGELENFHYNYDYSKVEKVHILDILCNECGELFPPILKLPKQKVMKTAMQELIDWATSLQYNQQQCIDWITIKNKAEQLLEKEEEDMIEFAEWIAKYPDKNKNVNREMLHAKSKYDSSERTIDLLQEWFEQFKKK